MLKKSQDNTKYKVYALVAPAIGSQLNYARLGQVITGIKQLGFYTVVKVALDANFIEGMACVNGCIGGAGNLTHGEKNKAAVDAYGREALEKTILDAIAPLQ